MNIDQLLGDAYHKDQVLGDGAGAVALIKNAVSTASEDEIAALKNRFKGLQEVQRARSIGNRSGDHVGAVLVSILGKALA